MGGGGGDEVGQVPVSEAGLRRAGAWRNGGLGHTKGQLAGRGR